jgi:Transcriptional regulators
MEVTMKQIAEEAKVSVSTVSRILNQDKSRKIKEETRVRVLQVAKDLGYFNKSLFSLSSKDSPALTVGCIFASDHESFVSPFFSSLLSGIQNEINEMSKNRNITFYPINCTQDSGLKTLNEIRLDAAVLLGRTNLETISFLKMRVPYLVYAGLNPIGGMDEVICDAREGVKVAVNNLYKLGHRDFVFAGSVDGSVFNEYRYRGFLEAQKELGLENGKANAIDCHLSVQDGFEAGRKLLEREKLPTAVVCGNDMVALGVSRALMENGKKVPEDVSIVGFDDIEAAAFFKPSLSTISVPKNDLGRFAMKILVDRLANPRAYNVSMRLPYRYIERESTGRVK